MNNNTLPDLGMFTDAGTRALRRALLDALSIPAYEFPDAWDTDLEYWFKDWVEAHPVHSGALAKHMEWTDTDVLDRVVWALKDPARGKRWLED